MGTVRKWGTAPVRIADKQYFSAEFQLENPRIFFQFKLRTTTVEPMFVVVKQGSQALECLRQGDVLPMTYHYQDRDIPAEKKKKKIKSIRDGGSMGFKDHLVIVLDFSGNSLDHLP